MDRKSRKIREEMQGAFLPKSYTDGLYLPEQKGRDRLIRSEG